MGSSPAPLPCLLTDEGGGYYSSAPGLLSLVIRDVKGTTQFNVAKSVVWDVTNFPPQVSVTRSCTATTFSFQVEAGKTYHVQMECIQLPSPYEASATLIEVCGQELVTIDVVNQMPGMMVEA